MHPLLEKKHTGVLLPLFSLRSKKDWGIGDISSMALWADALAELNLDILQLLPLNEMPPGVTCPYTALSAFALDPVYIAVEDIPELAQYSDLTAEINSRKFQAGLRRLRASAIVQYDDVKRLKFEFLWKLYCRFHERHILRNSPEAGDFFAFIRGNAYWLDDYALFRRLKDARDWASWTRWEAPLMRRDAAALREFESANENQILFFKYLQWIIDRQWKRTKEKAASRGVHLLGDLPFMVNQESADVWARRGDFDITKEIGAPPDAFSETGQKWGLPAYNWPEAEKNGFEWWRLKVRKASEFYDLFRIDHMVGFFRTWVIPHDVSLKPDFDIKDENAQAERGRKFLEALCADGPMLPVAEDLGVIPPYVPKVLAELGVPGYKVMRWEKRKDGGYTSPADYGRVSLATSSTHDNEPLADWWRAVDPVERRLFWLMVSGRSEKPPVFSKAREAILRSLLKASSSLVIVPAQDIFGFRDRINYPGTMGVHNWTYKFPVPVENLCRKYGDLLKSFSAMVAEERK